MSVKILVFDLGNTVLRELPQFQGLGLPMAQWPSVERMPGVEEALTTLHEQYRCCVASNSIYKVEFTAMALQRARLRHYFEHVFNSLEFGIPKPEAGFFQKILDEMQVTAAESVMIGDNYAKDIEPAKALGFRTVWLRETFSAAPAPAADAVISEMGELPAAIQKLTTDAPDKGQS